MTLEYMDAAFRSDLDRTFGEYDGDLVDVDLRIRDADVERLDEMLRARRLFGGRSWVRQDDIDGMRRRLERPADRSVAQAYSIDVPVPGAPRVTIERIVWRSRVGAP